MCVRSPNECWRQMKEKEQIHQCFVGVDPFIFKNILLKAFLNGQAVSIFFSVLLIFLHFLSAFLVSCCAWPLHSYTQHLSSLFFCGRNYLLALQMSHGVWFTDSSGWSRWLSSWKKGEENPYGHFCLHTKLSFSTMGTCGDFQFARAVLETYFLWPVEF